jgi:hypothetical protein
VTILPKYRSQYHHRLLFVRFQIRLGIGVCWRGVLASVVRVAGIRSRVRSWLYLYEGRWYAYNLRWYLCIIMHLINLSLGMSWSWIMGTVWWGWVLRGGYWIIWRGICEVIGIRCIFFGGAILPIWLQYPFSRGRYFFRGDWFWLGGWRSFFRVIVLWLLKIMYPFLRDILFISVYYYGFCVTIILL